MIEIIKKIINEDREFIIKFVIFFSGISFGVLSFVLKGEPIMLNYYQQWIVLIISILVAIYLIVFTNRKNK